MSKYLDLETHRYWDEDDGIDRKEWMTVTLNPWGISISREYVTRGGLRCVDPDAGITLHTRHLDALIDALVRLRRDLPKPTQQPGADPKEK